MQYFNSILITMFNTYLLDVRTTTLYINTVYVFVVKCRNKHVV